MDLPGVLLMKKEGRFVDRNCHIRPAPLTDSKNGKFTQFFYRTVKILLFKAQP